jgi:hypothetical protein
MLRKLLIALLLIAPSSFAQSSVQISLGVAYAGGSLTIQRLPAAGSLVETRHTFLGANGDTFISYLVPGSMYGFRALNSSNTGQLYAELLVNGAPQDLSTALLASPSGTGSTTLDASLPQFNGADDSIRIQNCFIALKAISAMAGICDARKLSGLTWSVNPWAICPANCPVSGKLLMPPGVTSVLYGPVVEVTYWGLEGVTTVPNTNAGSYLKAGALFPQPYSTGTVTFSGTGLGQTVTGVGTTWTDNIATRGAGTVAPGCVILAPSTQPTAANSTWAIIAQGGVTSTTTMNLAYVVNNGTGAAGGSSYISWCPLHLHADGSGSGGGASFGNYAVNMGFDANNIAGVIPDMNLVGQQDSYDENVAVSNFCGIGIDWETSSMQNSGQNRRLVMSPGSCGSAATIDLVIRANTPNFGFDGLTVVKSADPSTPAIGIAVNGGNVKLSNLDLELVTDGVQSGSTTVSCVPACVRPPTGAAGLEIDGAWGSATNLIHLNGASAASNQDAIIRDLNGLGTNELIDTANGCTIPNATESRVGKYELDHAGLIVSSSSLINSCRGKTPLTGTCTFAAATTCTIAYATNYVATPIVMLSPVNPGAVTFTLTSTANSGFTITASASNSLAVNYVVTGAPN